MPLIDWIPLYDTGIPEIDKDNQKLVGMINLLHDSISKQKNHEIVNQVIAQLAQNFQAHCKSSTTELQKIHYPYIAEQLESHKKFGLVLATFLKRIKTDEKISAMEVIGFLRNWFDRHIIIEDKKIRTFLKQKSSNKATSTPVIPPNIKKLNWHKSLSFENETIDSQHQDLISLYNKLYQAVELKLSNEIILNIVITFQHHARIHFKDEEQLMVTISYPEYETHAKIHKQLINEFEYFVKKINSDDSVSPIQILVYIHNWFVNHFKNTDGQLLKYLNKNIVLASQE